MMVRELIEKLEKIDKAHPHLAVKLYSPDGKHEEEPSLYLALDDYDDDNRIKELLIGK